MINDVNDLMVKIIRTMSKNILNCFRPEIIYDISLARKILKKNEWKEINGDV